MTIIADKALTPRDGTVRSPITQQLLGQGTLGTLETPTGQAIVLAEVEGPGTEAVPHLIDLTPLPRWGFRGVSLEAHHQAAEIALSDVMNRAALSEGGILSLRLAPRESLLLPDPATVKPAYAEIEKLQAACDGWELYELPRQDMSAWMCLKGPHCTALLSKVCAVDFSPSKFGPFDVAQTSIASVSAIVARLPAPTGTPDSAPEDLFTILCDWSSSVYLYSVLSDALSEYGGRAAGLASLMDKK